jgi:hypothetical protein
MANERYIFNGLVLPTNLADGTGDEILTISSTGVVGKIAAIGTPLSSTLADGRIFIGNASNVATGVATSGDITLSNTGVFAIATGVIVNTDVNASAAIAYSKLNLTGGIVNADVNASAAIAYSKLNLTGNIVDADINAAAAIARTKFANGNTNRVVINNASGVMIDNSAITANRAIISDANGLPTQALTTATEIGYVNGVTSSIQTQLNTTIVGKATSATLQSPGAGQNGFVISWDNGNNRFNLTSVSASGVPNGGTTNQILRKIDNVDQNTEWHTLVFGDLTDVSGTTITEINLLNGMTVGSAELNTLTGIGGNVQTQLDNKLSGALATNNLYVGVAGVATATTDLPTATTIGGAAIYRAGGSDVALADGGTGASLTDPGADRIFFWDESANSTAFLTPGNGIVITGTNIGLTGGSTNATLSGFLNVVATTANYFQIETSGPTTRSAWTNTGMLNTAFTTAIPGTSYTTVRHEDSNTSVPISAFNVESSTSGTAANGIGVDLNLGVENSTGSVKYATIRHILDDVTNTSEDSSIYIRGLSSGSVINFAQFQDSILTLNTLSLTTIGLTAAGPFALNAGSAISLITSNEINLQGSRLTSNSDFEITDSTKAFYMGDSATNGSWRFIQSGDNLLLQQREAGVYVTKQTFSGA